jgi:hypothetical protein
MTDFTFSGTIEFDTISSSGEYDITASGAQGGSGTQAAGGKGAAVGGDIYLMSGTVLEILVGGEGHEANNIGGGGGGSFVFETSRGTLTPVLIAGGGGGNTDLHAGSFGLVGQTGGKGYGTLGALGGVDGAPGAGAGNNGSVGGGGGGGYTGGTGGAGNFRSANSGAAGTTLASDFAGGAAGNVDGTKSGVGGFGGGGGAGYGGGGGGGYGGGGGGFGGGGGGGGSYLSAKLTNTTASAGIHGGNGDVTVDFVSPLCYLHGTSILTPTGLVKIEDLRIGDAVVTRFSGIQRVKFLGRQSYAPEFITHNPENWPVRIQAGALADGTPARDLYVSPGHSMLLGEVLVLASNLVNGVTITQRRPTTQLDYVQIDLGHHDCVLAEAAWSETFADAPGLRAQFHNAAEFHALYPDAPPPDELHLCAPRPQRGWKLEATLRTIAARAA